MRRVAALLLAGLLCLSLCACGDEPAVESPGLEPDVTVTPAEQVGFNLAYDPTADLHPITGDSQVNRMLTSLVYEGLYELDGAFVPQPVLARSAEVDESGLVWTITLKENVSFSDGTPLEVGHVVSSLNTARESSLYAGRLADVVSVRGAENGVVITLSQPNGALSALLDIPVVLEREGEPAPLGTGRYRYAQDGEELYLMVNYNRESDLPYDTIGLSPVTAADQRIAAFDSGAVSAVITDFSSPSSLGYSCSYEVWDYPTTDLLYVGFKTVDSPCDSNLVRRAFSRAFDRAGVVKDLLEGHGDAASLPISPFHEDWSGEAAAELGYDISAAADLLAQAGYLKNEEDGLLYHGRTALAVTLLVNSDNTVKSAIANQLAEALTGLGVTVTVSKLPWKDYLTALEEGQFDLYLGEVQLTGDFDVTELLTGSLNYGGYDAAAMAEQLSAWRANTDRARSWAARLLWSTFAEETPIAPLCFKRESLLVRWDTLTGLSPTRSDPFHGMENWVPAAKS